MKRFLAILVVCAVPALCADGIVPTLVKHLKTSKTYMARLADKMPEDGYSSKPNPAQMTFAEQLAHVAGSNAYFIAKISGAKSPIGEKPDKMNKASVIKMLNDSYDYVIKSVGALTPEQLHKEVDTPDGKMTGLEAVLFSMDHTAHHRGQCIVYLRVKNIAPPEYEF